MQARPRAALQGVVAASLDPVLAIGGYGLSVLRRFRFVHRLINPLAFSVTLAPGLVLAQDPERTSASESASESASPSVSESASASEPAFESDAESTAGSPVPTASTGTPEGVTPTSTAVDDTKSERRALRKARWRFSLDAPRRVGIETSLLWPAYPGLFFHLKSTVPIHKARGEVLLGAQGRVPQVRPEEGTFSNLDAVLGWRQYAVYGIHFDVMLNMGWGRLRDSPINGRDYDSFDIELMAVAGWRFGVGPLYFAIQPLGIANVLNRTNPWPIEGRGTPRTEGPIYVGNVLFGVQF